MFFKYFIRCVWSERRRQWMTLHVNYANIWRKEKRRLYLLSSAICNLRIVKKKNLWIDKRIYIARLFKTIFFFFLSRSVYKRYIIKKDCSTIKCFYFRRCHDIWSIRIFVHDNVQCIDKIFFLSDRLLFIIVLIRNVLSGITYPMKYFNKYLISCH